MPRASSTKFLLLNYDHLKRLVPHFGTPAFETSSVIKAVWINNLGFKGAIHSRLNWAILLRDVIRDGKTEQTAQFWQAIAQASELSFLVVFHTENCAVRSGNPTFSSVYLFLSTIVTRTKRHIQLTKKKTDKPNGKPVLCQRTFTSVICAVFLHN